MTLVEKYANAHFGKTHFFMRHPVLLTKENSIRYPYPPWPTMPQTLKLRIGVAAF